MHITSFGGLTISSSGTAETSLIPFDSSGKIPRFVRVAATAQGTLRVSANGESATAYDNPIQPGDSAVVATGGCRYISFLCNSGKLNVSALESGGWNTQSQEEYLTGLMTSLMTDGTQGWWYEPSDFSTLFQDVSGTIPVTAVEQSVALMLDKSGMGNHATQATSTSRPILRNRYNQFTETEFRNGVTDAPTRGGLVSATTLTGYIGALAFGHDGATTSYAYKTATHVNGVAYRLSLVVSMDDGLPPVFSLTNSLNTFTPVMFGIASSAVNPSEITVVGNADGTYTVTRTVVSSGATTFFGVAKYNTNNNRTFKVTAYDIRPIADAHLPYQRVNTATDYDSDPSKFPLYLDPDGSDDGMATAAFAAGSDKVTVFAAVHKRSDAAAGEVYGFSATPASNNGAFALTFPATAGATAQFTSKGTSASDAQASGISAPVTRVLTGVGDIAADISILRANGVQAASSTADQGTGTYGTYPLYLFRQGGTSLPFNGRFYGGAGKLRALSGAEASIPEQYLRMKSRAY